MVKGLAIALLVFSLAPVYALEESMPKPSELSVIEVKKLHFEFTKAQKTEIKALEHQHKMEIDELKASQRARLREWEQHEKEALKEFTAKKPKGPEMRDYIKDRKERRNALLKLQQDEMDKKRTEHSNSINQIKYDHTNKLKEFMEHLSRKEKPPENLWPAQGG
jgi:hypothetical protein